MEWMSAAAPAGVVCAQDVSHIATRRPTAAQRFCGAFEATTMFGPDPVPLLKQATRLEFAGGFSAKILPCLSLYPQAGYQFAVSGTDGGRRDGVKGDFGVRYSW
jgi:hypothetical protein